MWLQGRKFRTLSEKPKNAIKIKIGCVFVCLFVCVSFKLSYRTEAIEYARRRPLRG